MSVLISNMLSGNSYILHLPIGRLSTSPRTACEVLRCAAGGPPKPGEASNPLCIEWQPSRTGLRKRSRPHFSPAKANRLRQQTCRGKRQTVPFSAIILTCCCPSCLISKGTTSAQIPTRQELGLERRSDHLD